MAQVWGLPDKFEFLLLEIQVWAWSVKFEFSLLGGSLKEFVYGEPVMNFITKKLPHWAES